MHPSASAYLDALTSACTEVLGEDLVGVYPHGSLLLGGWRPERSDVDVLVVVDDALTLDEQGALAAALAEDSLPCPAVGLELSVVTRSAAAHPTARPAFELHVTTAPDDSKVVDGHGHPGDPDLVLHFAVCQRLDPEVFAEVPRSLVLPQLLNELAWAEEHASLEYTVLNACRAWRYAVDGRLVSKVDGGRWAEERLAGADLALVRTALAAQQGDRSADLDPKDALHFVLRCSDVVRIEASAPRSG